MKKGKSIKLNYKPELEFSLIGISSHENDYHLSWAINKHLKLKLTRSDNLSLMNKQHEIVQEFAVSSYEDEESMLLYNLISNSGGKGFLFTELRNIDYFLQIYGELSENQLIVTQNRLMDIDIVSASFFIDPSSLKSPEKLLFN